MRFVQYTAISLALISPVPVAADAVFDTLYTGMLYDQVSCAGRGGSHTGMSCTVSSNLGNKVRKLELERKHQEVVSRFAGLAQEFRSGLAEWAQAAESQDDFLGAPDASVPLPSENPDNNGDFICLRNALFGLRLAEESPAVFYGAHKESSGAESIGAHMRQIVYRTQKIMADAERQNSGRGVQFDLAKPEHSTLFSNLVKREMPRAITWAVKAIGDIEARGLQKDYYGIIKWVGLSESGTDAEWGCVSNLVEIVWRRSPSMRIWA